MPAGHGFVDEPRGCPHRWPSWARRTRTPAPTLRPMAVRLVIIGGGNMGAALLGGLVSGGWAKAEDLAVVEPVAARREQLEEQFPMVKVAEELTFDADGAVLATKPGQVGEAATAVAARVGRLLSIAAGVSTGVI